MNPESLERLAEEAEDILESYLTEIEKEEVFSNYRAISSQIRWKAVTDRIFTELLGDAYDLVFEVGDWSDAKYSKSDTWHLASEAEKALYEDKDPKSMARRHLLLLWMVRKMMGAMKTKVNQSIQDLPLLTGEEEEQLENLKDFNGEEESEEEDLESEEEREEEDEATYAEQEVEVVAELPENSEIDLSRDGDCLQGGSHARTITRYRRNDNVLSKETYCKDCRRVVEETPYVRPRRRRGPCKCEAAEWVEGKEGQEAVCSDPACRKPIKDPHTYKWRNSGLEPYGDDPTEDEATTLCSES